MAETTQAKKPPQKSSKESDPKQLAMARTQGHAFNQAVQEITRHVAHGAEKRAGDYLIGYAVEDAEGLYFLRDGILEWEEPQQANAHVEVVVRDGADGRFIPGLTVRATLLDASGNELGSDVLPFLWHPWLYHYGRNWMLPGDGEYTLRVRVEVPDFPRHDRDNGKRFTEPVEVEFRGVRIKTGQKK